MRLKSSSRTRLQSSWVFGTLVLSLFTSTVAGDCECGYSIVSKTDGERYVFADLLETDFIHVDITGDGEGQASHGWVPQGFNMSNVTAQGPYGIDYAVGNVMSNTISDPNVFTGPSVVGSDAGLRLVVQSHIMDGLVPAAQVATIEEDYFYGTFRAGIKITDVPGTCSAFFWFQNNTQEIDMEFLSSEFNKSSNTFPVNLVLQSKAAADGNSTGSHAIINLPFDPTTDFHEYRFDYLQNTVSFLADGVLLANLTGDGVPKTAGNILLSHWSNGNQGWSRGPPTADAVTTVSYVKAYFNSSSPQSHASFTQQCIDPAAPGAVCLVPDNNATFFFTEGSGDTNQTSGGGNGGTEGDGNGGTEGGGNGGTEGGGSGSGEEGNASLLVSPSYSSTWLTWLVGIFVYASL
ncbi:glycoside hydrolase, family 16 [Xylariaceae sp. FL0255]|nr:glycoside hydrolase, family 16 [Xylariaceae sp. FL0255]